MVLYVLSQIWKHGGVIERLPDGRLKLNNSGNIPETVLKAAEPIFGEIDAYLKSVEGMNAVDLTLWKMIVTIANWQKNEAINNFLCGDEEALNMFFSYQAKLAHNGWIDIYQNWMDFEDAETEKLKKQIYSRAIAFANKGAK